MWIRRLKDLFQRRLITVIIGITSAMRLPNFSKFDSWFSRSPTSLTACDAFGTREINKAITTSLVRAQRQLQAQEPCSSERFPWPFPSDGTGAQKQDDHSNEHGHSEKGDLFDRAARPKPFAYVDIFKDCFGVDVFQEAFL